MKALHVLLVVLALAAGAAAWLALGSNGDDVPVVDPATAAAAPSHQPPRTTADAERSAVPPPAAAVPAPTPPADAPTPGPATAPAEQTAAVHLVVRSATTREPVAAFRWRVRGQDETVHRGDGRDGRAGLALPPELRGELLVEADGHEPATDAQFAVPAAGSAPTDVEVFLTPAATATGITLLVHDVARQPVPNVRVDTFRLRPEDRELAWQLGKALWSRRTAAADGRYVLPELAAGDYGVRVLATDEQGEALPLLPFVRTFTLTGSNGFVEDVTLEPGCLLQLELVDPMGQPVDPARGAVTLGLRLPGGPAQARHWLQRRDTGVVRAEDALPGPGPAWLAEAVAAGTWQLDVLVDGQPALQRHLVLRAGERQLERLVVP